MRFSYTMNAGPGELFSQNAFDLSVGKPMNVNDATGARQGTCVAAVVADDGKSAEITVEVALGVVEVTDLHVSAYRSGNTHH